MYVAKGTQSEVMMDWVGRDNKDQLIPCIYTISPKPLDFQRSWRVSRIRGNAAPAARDIVWLLAGPAP